MKYDVLLSIYLSVISEEPSVGIWHRYCSAIYENSGKRSCKQSSVAPARGGELKKVVFRVCGIFNDVSCLLPGGWVWGFQHFFSCPYCSLQPVPVQFCDCDGYAQVKFNDSSVELGQQLLWQTMLPQLLQKVHPLLGLFEHGLYVIFPLLVLRNGSSK